MLDCRMTSCPAENGCCCWPVNVNSIEMQSISAIEWTMRHGGSEIFFFVLIYMRRFRIRSWRKCEQRLSKANNLFLCIFSACWNCCLWICILVDGYEIITMRGQRSTTLNWPRAPNRPNINSSKDLIITYVVGQTISRQMSIAFCKMKQHRPFDRLF